MLTRLPSATLTKSNCKQTPLFHIASWSTITASHQDKYCDHLFIYSEEKKQINQTKIIYQPSH